MSTAVTVTASDFASIYTAALRRESVDAAMLAMSAVSFRRAPLHAENVDALWLFDIYCGQKYADYLETRSVVSELGRARHELIGAAA